MFLDVFGHTIRVGRTDGDNRPFNSGVVSASYSNQPIDARQAPLDTIDLVTRQESEEEAYALSCLLAEDWHYFPMNAAAKWLWSDDGLGPEIGVSATMAATYAQITDATWNTRLIGPWSVMITHANAGAPSEHVVVRSDGAKWFDGVRNDATATAWLSVGAEGQLSISSENVNEMVVFRTLISASMVASFYTFQSSNTWTKHLLCSGDFRDDLTTTGKQFMGSVMGQNVRRGSNPTWVETDRVIQFRLEEVPS